VILPGTPPALAVPDGLEDRLRPPGGGRFGWFAGTGDARLRFATWTPGNPRGNVVVHTGRSEFIEKYGEVVRDLLARDLAVWIMDTRGQGLSERPLGNPQKPWIRDYATYVGDLRRFVSEVVEFAAGPRLLLAHSMGGHIAVRLLREETGLFDAAALSAPMFRTRIPPLSRLLVRLVDRHGPESWGKAYVRPAGDWSAMTPYLVDASIISSDPVRYRVQYDWFVAHPELRLGAPTVAWAAATVRANDELLAPGFVEAIGTPVLIASAGRDLLVRAAAQRDVATRMPGATLLEVPGAKHEILMERDEFRGQFWAAFDALLARLA
jgi:lysophospholipase